MKPVPQPTPAPSRPPSPLPSSTPTAAPTTPSPSPAPSHEPTAVAKPSSADTTTILFIFGGVAAVIIICFCTGLVYFAYVAGKSEQAKIPVTQAIPMMNTEIEFAQVVTATPGEPLDFMKKSDMESEKGIQGNAIVSMNDPHVMRTSHGNRLVI